MSAIEFEILSHIHQLHAIRWASVSAWNGTVVPTFQPSRAILFAISNCMHVFRVTWAATLMPAIKSVSTDQLTSPFRRLHSEVVGGFNHQRRIWMPVAA